MVLRIIMHFWCASSLLCLLSPCLSKVVQWFNVFRYRIPYWCTKPPKLYSTEFMTIIKKFACCPLARQVERVVPEIILWCFPSAFMDIMRLDDFLGYLFRTDFRTDFLVDRFSGDRFSGSDFQGQIFDKSFKAVLTQPALRSCLLLNPFIGVCRQHCTLSQTQINWYVIKDTWCIL